MLAPHYVHRTYIVRLAVFAMYLAMLFIHLWSSSFKFIHYYIFLLVGFVFCLIVVFISRPNVVS